MDSFVDIIANKRQSNFNESNRRDRGVKKMKRSAKSEAMKARMNAVNQAKAAAKAAAREVVHVQEDVAPAVQVDVAPAIDDVDVAMEEDNDDYEYINNVLQAQETRGERGSDLFSVGGAEIPDRNVSFVRSSRSTAKASEPRIPFSCTERGCVSPSYLTRRGARRARLEVDQAVAGPSSKRSRATRDRDSLAYITSVTNRLPPAQQHRTAVLPVLPVREIPTALDLQLLGQREIGGLRLEFRTRQLGEGMDYKQLSNQGVEAVDQHARRNVLVSGVC